MTIAFADVPLATASSFVAIIILHNSMLLFVHYFTSWSNPPMLKRFPKWLQQRVLATVALLIISGGITAFLYVPTFTANPLTWPQAIVTAWLGLIAIGWGFERLTDVTKSN